MALSPDGQEGWRDAAILFGIALLATLVKAAGDPPRGVAAALLLLGAGLGMATGGWLLAKAAGLEGWAAMAMAWMAGALGRDTLLPLLKRWAEARAPK